jgi:hypothetical protein
VCEGRSGSGNRSGYVGVGVGFESRDGKKWKMPNTWTDWKKMKITRYSILFPLSFHFSFFHMNLFEDKQQS